MQKLIHFSALRGFTLVFNQCIDGAISFIKSLYTQPSSKSLPHYYFIKRGNRGALVRDNYQALHAPSIAVGLRGREFAQKNKQGLLF